jgi:cell division protease FtsH
LEKETVMGSELDAIILEMRPGFDFPSKHEPVSTPAPEKSKKADESPEAVSASDADTATEDPAAEPSGDNESDNKSDDKG